jgi:DNA-binding NarL/FixJ family response regulator
LVLDTEEATSKAIAEPLRCVGLAEDSATIREAGSAQPLSLAILDVEMPIMNGVQAAMSMRELEKQLGLNRRTPVLFFTSRKCDDRFKQVLAQLQPSSYVNKGASTDPVDLARRVHKVLGILLQNKASG